MKKDKLFVGWLVDRQRDDDEGDLHNPSPFFIIFLREGRKREKLPASILNLFIILPPPTHHDEREPKELTFFFLLFFFSFMYV